MVNTYQTTGNIQQLVTEDKKLATSNVTPFGYEHTPLKYISDAHTTQAPFEILQADFKI
jgi:hypothetical protein